MIRLKGSTNLCSIVRGECRLWGNTRDRGQRASGTQTPRGLAGLIFDSEGKGRKRSRARRRGGLRGAELCESGSCKFCASGICEIVRTDFGSVGSLRGGKHERLSDKTLPQGSVVYHGEFDPGSERTLAARFKHASRTVTWVAIPEQEWRTGE